MITQAILHHQANGEIGWVFTGIIALLKRDLPSCKNQMGL